MAALGVLLVVRHEPRRPEPVVRHPPVSPRQHRVKIGGFQFQGSREGRRVISIRADRFTVEKKKLGFFRLGILSEARFTNAVIDLYGTREAPEEKGPATPGRPAGPPVAASRDPGPLSFEGSFTRESLPSLSGKGIASIRLEPVAFNLHEDTSLITRISADSATVRLKQRDVLFRGKVRVESGGRLLTTARLSFMPKTASFATRHHFVLEAPEKRVEGEGITTDLYLR